MPEVATKGPPQGWAQALAFAVKRHGKALRKGTRIPYVTHVVGVAETLAYYYPDRDELIVAGLLHDTVEDTDATFEKLEQKFGSRVAALVRAVSKDDVAMAEKLEYPSAEAMRHDLGKRERWRARREFMLDHVRGTNGDPDVLRLKASDACANLTAILRDLRNPLVGDTVWERFKVGRDDSLWYYDEIMKVVDAGIGSETLTGELRRTLDAVRDAG